MTLEFLHVVPSVMYSIADAAGQAAIASLWQAACIAAGVALLLRAAPNTSASTRSWTWRGVLLFVLALPFLNLFASRPGASAVHESPGLHLRAVWAVGMLAAWAAFSLLRAAQLAWSAITLHRIAHRATAFPAPPSIARLLGRVRIGCSEEVDRPSVAGLLTPIVLLPEGLHGELSQGELEILVRHELEHLRRNDHWVNLLQKLALVAMPFHPVLLWLDRRLSLERELACDEGVLRATGAPKAYAATLARLAEDSMVRRGLSLALGAWERRSELAHRVHRILAGPGVVSPAQRRFAMASTGTLMLAAVAGVAHAPVLVSFGGAPHLQIASITTASVSAAATQAPSSMPAIVPVMAHPAASRTHAVMATRVMPFSHSRFASASPAIALVPRRTPREVNTKVLLTTAPRRSQPDAARVTLTTFRPNDPALPAPRVIYAVQSENGVRTFVPAYAEVPWGEGWLVIQL